MFWKLFFLLVRSFFNILTYQKHFCSLVRPLRSCVSDFSEVGVLLTSTTSSLLSSTFELPHLLLHERVPSETVKVLSSQKNYMQAKSVSGIIHVVGRTEGIFPTS